MKEIIGDSEEAWKKVEHGSAQKGADICTCLQRINCK